MAQPGIVLHCDEITGDKAHGLACTIQQGLPVINAKSSLSIVGILVANEHNWNRRSLV